MQSNKLPRDVASAMRRMKILGDDQDPPACRLSGGVSSAIWRVRLATGDVCVKQALPRLQVEADWQVPTVRNLYEARWMRRAAAACPGSVPELLGQDPESGTLAMAFLSPEDNKLWKQELRAGRADPAIAAEVGARLSRIHAVTAADPAVAAEFPTDAIFEAIRIEPYLLATAHVHPGLAARLAALAATTRSTKLALVHGDVSPKNILIGPGGPVFLDAECACWGDPAFDLAFCLNHLLLKCLWTPSATAAFLDCFHALAERYAAAVDWEAPAALERRAAELLPGLLLARIDGKSPVEYVTDPADKDLVRRVASGLLRTPVQQVAQVSSAWRSALRG